MTRARLASLADGLFFFFVGLAFVVDLTGGLRFGRSWYRLTATDPARLLGAALAIVVVRHLIVRHPSLRDRLTARRAARQSPTTADQPLTSPTRREWLIAIGVMAIATVWLLQDQVFTITGVPDRGDPFFSMWRLAWVAHQLVANPIRLFDANIFFPEANTLAYSDATLLPGLLVAPFLWMGVPVAVMHGLLYVASFFLAALSMFLLVRSVTGRLEAGLLAGILFGFYPYRLSTYSHLEMQGVFLMPLALLALLRVLERGRTRDGVWLGIWLSAEMLWSLYLGAYLAVGLGAVLVVRWAGGHFTVRQRIRALGAAAVVAAAVIGPYSRPYWAARNIVGERPRDETRGFSAEPRDVFSMNEMNRLYGKSLSTDVTTERQLFPGGTALLLGAAALAPPVSSLGAACVAGAAVAFDGALGVHGAAFTWLYEKTAAFRAFRVPARFGTLMGLFISMLAGLGLARILAEWPGQATTAAAIVLIAFSAFELRARLELTPSPLAAPSAYAAVRDDPRAVIVELPLPNDDGEYWIDPTYLYYSTFHWRPLINGYSGFTPMWYSRLKVASREFPSDESMQVLRDRGATAIVLHQEFYPPDRYKEVVTALEQRQDVELIGARPASVGEIRVYRLRPR
jgi:hypothetical protein